MGGVDLGARKHFLNGCAEKRREGDAAPEAIVEEVSEDRGLGEGAREQSTCSTGVEAPQSLDVDVHDFSPTPC